VNNCRFHYLIAYGVFVAARTRTLPIIYMASTLTSMTKMSTKIGNATISHMNYALTLHYRIIMSITTRTNCEHLEHEIK
jgi:hypothetical protein